MAEQGVVHYRFRLRRAKKATWVSKNDTLLDGELGVEKETGRAKKGPGEWNDLDYFNIGNVDLRNVKGGQTLAWDAQSDRFRVATVRGIVWAEFQATPDVLDPAATRAVTVPYDFTITGWRVVSDGQSGSATIDVFRRETFDGQAVSITGGNKIDVVDSPQASSDDLTNWGTSGFEMDQIIFQLEEATFQALRVELEMEKT